MGFTRFLPPTYKVLCNSRAGNLAPNPRTYPTAGRPPRVSPTASAGVVAPCQRDRWRPLRWWWRSGLRRRYWRRPWVLGPSSRGSSLVGQDETRHVMMFHMFSYMLLTCMICDIYIYMYLCIYIYIIFIHVCVYPKICVSICVWKELYCTVHVYHCIEWYCIIHV